MASDLDREVLERILHLIDVNPDLAKVLRNVITSGEPTSRIQGQSGVSPSDRKIFKTRGATRAVTTQAFAGMQRFDQPPTVTGDLQRAKFQVGMGLAAWRKPNLFAFSKVAAKLNSLGMLFDLLGFQEQLANAQLDTHPELGPEMREAIRRGAGQKRQKPAPRTPTSSTRR